MFSLSSPKFVFSKGYTTYSLRSTLNLFSLSILTTKVVVLVEQVGPWSLDILLEVFSNVWLIHSKILLLSWGPPITCTFSLFTLAPMMVKYDEHLREYLLEVFFLKSKISPISNGPPPIFRCQPWTPLSLSTWAFVVVVFFETWWSLVRRRNN